MAPTQKRAPSKRSRAARRATSPSINTDKSLKDVSLPSATSASSLRHSVLSARHSSGVAKKSRRGRQLSAKGRRRQEKGLEMAEAFIGRTSKKLEKSFGKAKVVQARSKKWEDINKAVRESKVNSFEVLNQGGEDEEEVDEAKGAAEWETDDDVDGDDSAEADAVAAPLLDNDDDDDDEIM